MTAPEDAIRARRKLTNKLIAAKDAAQQATVATQQTADQAVIAKHATQ